MSLQIYVLKLENDKWYVGKTNDIMQRFQQHVEGDASAWTTLYKPIRIEEIKSGEVDNFDEDKITKKLMAKYGIDNVRGGSYVTIELTNEQKKFLNNELNMSSDRCILCKEIGHFIKDCPKNNANILSPIVPLKPNNCGTKWTPLEEQQLLNEIEQAKSINDIANLHQRTNGAISSRLRLIAYNFYQTGLSIDEIIQKTKLDRLDVLDAIKGRTITQNKEIQKIKNEVKEDNILPISEICNKCGRSGHNYKNCYTKTHIGQKLSSTNTKRTKKIIEIDIGKSEDIIPEPITMTFEEINKISKINDNEPVIESSENIQCDRCGRNHKLEKCYSTTDIDNRLLLNIGDEYNCLRCNTMIYHNQICTCPINSVKNGLTVVADVLRLATIDPELHNNNKNNRKCVVM
jgi:hypothetical protein